MHEQQHDPERQPICRSVRERPGPDGALSLEQLANRITELAAPCSPVGRAGGQK